MITIIKSLIKGKTSYLDMIENGALVVDVRHPEEFALGNILESINIPLGLLPNRIYEMKGKTVIAIAHRLSTISAMDRLIVMDNGQIIEDGTHKSLLIKKGLYYDLWQRQSGGFIGD